MAGGVLGCGPSTLVIADRGGARQVADLGTPQLSWARKLGDMTELRATIPVTPDEPLDVRPWVHEAQVWRDGNLEWVGPLRTPSYTRTTVTIPARDLWMWLERRWLPNDINLTTDLGALFELLARDALDQDASPNITLDIDPAGVIGSRIYTQREYVRAADALRELGRTAVDWTMIGRTLRAGGRALDVPDMPPLLDHMVANPNWVPRGEEAASDVAVLGGTPSGGQVVGRATRNNPDTGLVQLVLNEPLLDDQESADANADAQVDWRNDEPGTLTCDLTPDGPAMSQLIPGARCAVALSIGCLELVRELRLDQVQVTQNVGNEGVTERVALTLVTLGVTR